MSCRSTRRWCLYLLPLLVGCAGAVGAQEGTPAFDLRAPLDIRKTTIAQYNGAVSAAMEAMRCLLGQMTPEETRAFERQWAPLFDCPTPEILAYFDRLNPLLDDFLSVRAAVGQAALEFDASWAEATRATAHDDREGARAALAIALQQKDLLQSLNARLADLVRRIEALGSPPDPAQARARARKRHNDGIAAAKRLLPRLSIDPARPKTRPGEPCRLTPKGQNLPAGAVVTWSFGDGGAATGSLSVVTHRYARAGKYTVKASVRGGSPPALLAQASTQVEVGAGPAPGAGVWQLQGIDRKVFRASRLASYVPEAWKTKCQATDSSFTFTADTGFRVEGGPPPATHTIALTWTPLPRSARPGETFCLQWQGSRRASPEPAVEPLNYAGLQAVLFGTRRLEGNWGRGVFPQGGPRASDVVHSDPDLVKQGPYQDMYLNSSLIDPEAKWARLAFPSGAPGDQLTLAVMADVYPRSFKRLPDFGCLVVHRYLLAPAGAAATPVVSREIAESDSERARRERDEALEMHRINMAAIGKALADARARLAAGTGDVEAEAFRVRCMESDLLDEQDRVRYIETGEYQHTRSPFDEYERVHFIANIAQTQQDLKEIQRTRATVERLVQVLPEEMRDEARRRAMAGLKGTIQYADAEKARAVVSDLLETNRRVWDAEAAKGELKADAAETNMAYAKGLATACGMIVTGGTGAILTGMGYTAGAVTAGEVVAGVLYGGTTGYLSGGPVEAVKEAATLSGTVGMVVVQAVEAGHEAAKGGKDWNEVIQTGAWEGLKGLVFGKAMEYGAARVFAKGKGGKAGASPSPPRSPQTVAQAVSAREYQRSIGAGRKLAEEFRQAQVALANARKAGAPAAEITRLQEALRKKAWEVNSSYGAKVALRKGGNNPVSREFERQQQALHRQVDEAFEKEIGESFHYEEWTPAGWQRRELKWQDIRNASSTGFNIDRDKGLIEKPLWSRGKDGKPYPVKENWVLHADGSPKMPRYRLVNKQGQRVTMASFNKEAQDAYNRTYRRVSGGRDPEAAFQTVTTSANPEAYRSKDWIKDLSDAENVAILEGTGAKSAAEVARGKGYHGPAPGVDAVTKNVEVARAGAKEINKRLLNVLKAKGADSSTLKYWEEMADALQRYSDDPVGGYHKLQQLAGGKSVPEAMDDIATALEGAITFGK